MTVSGQIINEATGQPLPGALVQVADETMSPLGKQATTDQQGNFSIDTINNLAYLLVTENGYSPIFISINDFMGSQQAGLQPSGATGLVQSVSNSPLLIIAIVGMCYALFFKKKKKLGDVDYTDLLLKIGIPVAAYFLIVKPILANLGIVKSGAASGAATALKNQDNAVSSGLTAFSPLFYQQPEAVGATIFTQAAADSIANEIYNSVGWLWDTPTQGVAAFNQCSTQAQVSFVADRFNTLYNLDLYTWLRQKYDTDIQQEMLQQIVQYVNSLPKYTA